MNVSLLIRYSFFFNKMLTDFFSKAYAMFLIKKILRGFSAFRCYYEQDPFSNNFEIKPDDSVGKQFLPNSSI